MWEARKRRGVSFLSSSYCNHPKTSLFHYSGFFVAETNGQYAGALSGYDPKVLGMTELGLYDLYP
ncbi:MAG: hypothetical protein RBG13Loki_4155 [Promethearchaeota archaeon CR_4]|nr:MAG: hypothetical protein RBG13Loki_4155 [Candidatus Lokiarchaeota archaeon CR_4]